MAGATSPSPASAPAGAGGAGCGGGGGGGGRRWRGRPGLRRWGRRDHGGRVRRLVRRRRWLRGSVSRRRRGRRHVGRGRRRGRPSIRRGRRRARRLVRVGRLRDRRRIGDGRCRDRLRGDVERLRAGADICVRGIGGLRQGRRRLRAAAPARSRATLRPGAPARAAPAALGGLIGRAGLGVDHARPGVGRGVLGGCVMRCRVRERARPPRRCRPRRAAVRPQRLLHPAQPLRRPHRARPRRDGERGSRPSRCRRASPRRGRRRRIRRRRRCQCRRVGVGVVVVQAAAAVALVVGRDRSGALLRRVVDGGLVRRGMRLHRGDLPRRRPADVLAALLAEVAAGRVLQPAVAARRLELVAHDRSSVPSPPPSLGSEPSPPGGLSGGRSSSVTAPSPGEAARGTSGSVRTRSPRRTRSL